MLVDRGFGVFAFDGPGHGRSGGKVTWDEFERATLSAAIDHCSNEASGTPVAIGILGFRWARTSPCRWLRATPESEPLCWKGVHQPR